ncbi:HIT family protein [Nocardioides mesophilus]|uniref:HIT domain-containing protein n=1 Tax=Nocardioides mesophilus TaxID=433659 RepID=A0A7G9R8X6_9ACTN|nr:HIT domain-containing protein [Nocardioides mesophilus]QNN52051.1 HIT domain-containing protein [Nocardioides mesophilus]
MSSCIFCQIVAGEAEAFVIASSPDAVAFLDIAPLSRGHSLVVPTRHVSDLLEGGAEVLAEVAPVVEETARLLVGRLRADGINLFQSSGTAAGQEVPHFHVHLVPRWRDDGVLRNLVGEPSGAEDLDALHVELLG